jgi:histidinol-phosphatase (PHP family)
MQPCDRHRAWASFHGGHTAFGDGRGSISEVAQAAADRGFLAFGFTEHFTTPPIKEFNPGGLPNSLANRSNWLGDYVKAVQAEQRKHDGQFSIVLGTELEYIPGAEAWTREEIRPWPFEYFVGSVHFVRYDGVDICIDSDRSRTEEALRRAGSPERLYLDYYDHVLELLDWRLARVIGHLDLIKIFLTSDEQVKTEPIRSKVNGILETMRDRNVAMDINARGLIKACRAIYPADWILSDAYRIGVRVTLGDDSHGPDEVGARLEHAVAALRRAGFSEMAIVGRDGNLQSAPLPQALVS